MIHWKRQPQEVVILLCAMVYAGYDLYAGMKSCRDARRFYRAYRQGLKALTPENRAYFDPEAVIPAYYSDEARREADRIFWENF